MNNEDKKLPDPLLEKLKLGLDRLDNVYSDLNPPSLSALTLRIKAEAINRRNRERKEMLLFWLLSLCLMGSCLILLLEAPLFYLVIQGAVPAAALVIAAVIRLTRKGQGAAE
ncbi:DUF5345 family protein [Paenibacillus wynnii]|uniref:YxlC family protein n=1 Tax=Paenibacillus wynnii TaxID=268407 RepID=A0A098MFW9_9BACL|nr:DUF5345 family protein [Paenibacillus wynnii]KGE20943.1 hypothetical protein PWYN_01930 [Paenibacillus wynnii]